MGRAEGLTNQELAANPTWVLASTRLRCPDCGFLGGLALQRLSAPCPNCGISGSIRETFPSVVAIRWLQIVAEAYVKACKEAEGRRAALVRRIQLDLDQPFDAKHIEVARRKMRMLSRPLPPAERGGYLLAFQRSLTLRSKGDAEKLWYLLATYTDTTPQHCNVVTSTTSLFEELFRELMVDLLVSRGSKRVDAKREVKAARRRKDLERMFEKIIGIPLPRAAAGYGVRGLYEAWQEVAAARNKFLHASPWAIGAAKAEKAFNAAKHAIGLFVFMHNKYCLTQATLA